ncbi:hypothetical protein D3C80_1754030 [compost metagenome]
MYLEQDPCQVGEFFERLELAQQAFLLVAQACGPVAVGDDQQQAAFAPGSHVAMLARGRLQLAVQQALQVTQAFGVAEDGFQRLGFAQQNGGRLGWKRAKGHE